MTIEPLSVLTDTNFQLPEFLQIPEYSPETYNKLSNTFGSAENLDKVIAEWQAGDKYTYLIYLFINYQEFHISPLTLSYLKRVFQILFPKMRALWIG